LPPFCECLTTRIQAILTGGTILRVSIDPLVGGATIVEGGHPAIILSAGYIGSTLFGGVFILAGWDTLVAKIMSFVIGIGLICPLVLVRDKLCVPITWFGGSPRAYIAGIMEDDPVDCNV
jgi:hypothetical protein